jgi:hypothetical protein
VRPNRKARRAQKFQCAEKGFGPRHAFNAQEGDELVPEELPGPPPEDLRIRPNSMGNLRPANLLKALGGELGSLTKEDVAKLGISLLMGGEGPREPSLPPSGKVPQPGLKFHDPHPRYEGPPEIVKPGNTYWDEYEKSTGLKKPKDVGESIFDPEAENPEIDKAANEAFWKKKALDKQFPSLNKPPYDALKEPGSDQHLPEFTEADYQEVQDAMAGYKSPHNELTPETWHPKWEDLPDDVKREYPNPDIMTETDWAKIKEHLDQPPEQKYTHWLGEPVPKKPGSDSFGDMTSEDKADLQKFHDDMAKKFPPDKIQNDEPPEEPPFDWKNTPPAPKNWPKNWGDLPPDQQQFFRERWNWQPPEGFAKGTKGVRQPRKFRGYPPVRKVGVAKGFGPRHSENVKEGEMPDLTATNTDTVPAMLTPREAVLNRNAAELAGRPEIEALNKQGNELAKQGVDLAATGESNVPDPKASDRRLAGTGAASYLTRELFEKYGGSPTAFELVPDFLKYISQEYPQMAQKGTANMKPKPKSPPSKPKPAPKPVKPTAPPSGSPYVQGFEGLQSGGYAGGQPGSLGEGTRNFPHPMAGKMHPSMPGLGGTGMQPYAPQPLQGVGGPEPVQQNRDFPHPNAGLMHPGGPYSEPPGGYNAGLGGGAVLGGTGGYGQFPTGGGTNWMGGGGGEPPGAYGAKPFQGPNLKGLGSGSFYPKGGQGYAGGTTDVIEPIGSANTSAAYGPPIQLSAPALANILQKAGQQNGLSTSQIAGLAKAFQGFQSGYNELSGGPGSAADMATAASGGYQGGISEVGYPPGIAPNADFSYTDGGWTGPLDPRWSSPGYQGGENDIEPGRLRGNINPDSWVSNLPPGVTVFGGRHPGSGFINRSSYNPGGSFSGAPGMPWSPTMIPTTYDPQGYPYGVPVQGPDQNVQGVGRTHNLRKNQ